MIFDSKHQVSQDKKQDGTPIYRGSSLRAWGDGSGIPDPGGRLTGRSARVTSSSVHVGNTPLPFLKSREPLRPSSKAQCHEGGRVLKVSESSRAPD